MEEVRLDPADSSTETATTELTEIVRARTTTATNGPCYVYWGVIAIGLCGLIMIFINFVNSGATPNDKSVDTIVCCMLIGVPGLALFGYGIYRCTKSRGKSCADVC